MRFHAVQGLLKASADTLIPPSPPPPPRFCGLQWFLPESPRWLITHARDAEAFAAFKLIRGDLPEEDMVVEFSEMREQILYEKVSSDGTGRSETTLTETRWTSTVGRAKDFGGDLAEVQEEGVGFCACSDYVGCYGD